MLTSLRHALLAALVLAAMPGSVGADTGNRNLLPVGEREAMLANAGITSASGGSVFYNPANLARLTHATISMSGTTLMRFARKADSFFGDQPFDNSGFVIIPASLVSTHQLGAWGVATAVMVPDHFEFDHHTSYTIGDRDTTLLQQSSRRDLWLGVSAARRFGERVSVGLSLFGVRRSASSLVFLQSEQPDEMGEPVAIELLGRSSFDVYGLTAVAGVYVQLLEQLGVGARVQSPLWQLYGKGDVFLSLLSSQAQEDGSLGAFELNEQGIDVNDPLPTDLGVGVSVRAHPRVELLVDCNLQLPLSYDESSDDAFSSERELETTFRVSSGVEVKVNDAVTLQGGFTYNPSAVPDPEDQVAREDYFGGTVGVAWKLGRTRTGVGAFYYLSDGETVAADAGDITSSEPVVTDLRSTLFGILITAAYDL